MQTQLHTNMESSIIDYPFGGGYNKYFVKVMKDAFSFNLLSPLLI